jgi:uncharacterized membrane protein YedE/YeeE
MRPPLSPLLTALLAGVLFGFGLAIARMTDPQKIKDFLDVAAIPAGGWDPSLAFVMGGGLVVAFFGLRLDRVLARPLAAPAFSHGTRTAIDRPLVLGAAIFGLGWGLSGFCPGPAIADLGIVAGSVWPFVLAMVAGSWATGLIAEHASGGAALEAADAAAE